MNAQPPQPAFHVIQDLIRDLAQSAHGPKTLQAQIRAVRDQLETAPMDAATLASYYKLKPEKYVTQVVEALTELGMIGQDEAGAFSLRGLMQGNNMTPGSGLCHAMYLFDQSAEFSTIFS